MRRAHLPRILIPILLPVVLGSCSHHQVAPELRTPTVLPAGDAAPHTVDLDRVAPGDQVTTSRGTAVVVDAYFAASNRRCARLRWQAHDEDALWCRFDDGWHPVPDIVTAAD